MAGAQAKCLQCGEPLGEKSRFCPSCGQPASSDGFHTLTVAVGSTPAPPSAGSGRRPSTHTSSTRAGREGRFPPGAVLGGRYRIVALLGKGGMGEVYRADDLTLDQTVALKFLPESLLRHPEAVARFLNEVRTARQVSHPNVCRVYDLNEIEGQFVLSMEYVDGEDLASLLRRIGRVPADKALEIARKLCAGLAAAHEKGVLHRDLKPSNIMLDGRGHVLLTDFGLAGIAGEIEGSEIRNGTPAYMAPEQLAGEEVTMRSDIYSLGLVLYEVFTGKLPFEAETLAGLIRLRSESQPVSPTTIARDLDPAVERVILRCLEAKPAARPASAMAVAAALPGGDPLAAALAAGETPSPEMVAAAGEGVGLGPRMALLIFLGAIAMMAATFALHLRQNALERVRPVYTPEVLAQKARDLIARLGYNSQPADEADGFDWNYGYLEFLGKKKPDWNRVLREHSALKFWFRQADAPLITTQFHDDLLTPGQVTNDDPPFTESGMVYVILDSNGRLLQFEAQPPQKMEVKQAAADWGPLFAAAGVDESKLRPAAPVWNWIEAADTRLAWTGDVDGQSGMRVEAGALGGKPVYFETIGAWTEPWRKPKPEPAMASQWEDLILSALLLTLVLAGPWLAHKNLAAGRGDRRGAFRLGIFMLTAEMAIWLCRAHVAPSLGMFGVFIIAVAAAVFYAVAAWTVYLAAEPYVRRRWPHCLISWTSVLAGRWRDPIVGRDVLIGIALGAALPLVNSILRMAGGELREGPLETLLGFRATLAEVLAQGPHSVRDALSFVFVIFLLRALLRKGWLAGGAFAMVFTAIGSHGVWWVYFIGFAIYALFAVIMLRWGLLSMAAMSASSGILDQVQASSHPGGWYFLQTALLLGIVAAAALWSLRTSIAGQKLWKVELFD